MQPILGVIADDLTGGMETAAMLVALGVDCGFVTRPALVKETASSPAIVVAQKTRVIPAADAVRRSEEAAEALLKAGARRLFFKYCATFDSTDKGNIGPVTDGSPVQHAGSLVGQYGCRRPNGPPGEKAQLNLSLAEKH